MDRKLLLKIVSGISLLFGLGIIISTGLSYWEYYSFGVFIDLEERLDFVISGLMGVSVVVVAVFIPLLFRRWALEDGEASESTRI